MATQRSLHLDCSKTSGKVNLGFVLTQSVPRRLIVGLNGARSRSSTCFHSRPGRIELENLSQLVGVVNGGNFIRVKGNKVD